MSGQIAPHQIALACGTAGAYVDVTSYVEFGEGVTYTYGRPDQFSDPTPGIFGFTLNNSDGRFTPGNTASPLATPVTEGMGVSWLLGARLVHGTVLAVEIPADEATWYQIRFACDDMLGTAGRHQLTSIADGLAATALPQLWWKLDEDSEALSGAEQSSSPLGAFTNTSGPSASTSNPVTFGVPQHPALPGTAVTLTAADGDTTSFGTARGNTLVQTNIPYPIPTDTTKSYYFGWWSFWIYPGSTGTFRIYPHWAVGAGYSNSVQVIVTPTSVGVKGGIAAAATHTYTSAEQTAPHFVSVRPNIQWQSSGSYWAMFVELHLDGVYLTSVFFQSTTLGFVVPPALLADGSAFQPVEVSMWVANPAGSGTTQTCTFQRVVHTLNGSGIEQNALYATEDERRAVLDTLSAELSSAAYNGRPSLSSALIGYPSVDGRSVLDVYNDIVRTEQGHLFCTTSGTLTAPVEQIQVRDRDRPTTVKATFDVAADGDGIPVFLRDITNVARSVQVAGPDTAVTVTDSTVTGRYVTSGLSETVLLEDPGELRLWGQDRLNRGKNVGIRIDTVTVDALTTPTVRAADLLALVPGDRVRASNLPAGILGFGTWDGWLIGATETHGQGQHQFVLRLQPCLTSPSLTDTARAANGGDLTPAGSVTASATTVTVVSASGNTPATDVPYDMTYGTSGEQVTVTAVSGMTLTIVRGVNGTTAVAHTTASPLEFVAAATAVY